MTRAGAVLILDDDADVLKAARLALVRDVDRVDTLDSAGALPAALQASRYDVVLLDMNFAPGDHSGREGLDGLACVKATDPDLSVVLMTVFGGVALAVEALKRGAADFVLKPWRNQNLLAAVEAAAALTQSRRAEGAMLNLDVLERYALERALARYDGNVSQAAAALGLTRPALYRRMAKHGL